MSIPCRRTRIHRRLRRHAILASFAVILATGRPGWSLTLADAVDAALRADPELAALEHETRALAAVADQARLLPNPELQTEVENVGGTGGRENDEAAESTLRLAQKIELGGKRSARSRVATSAVDVAAADLQLRRREVTATVKSAFAAALAAQQRVVLARDLERLAGESLRSVGSAVGAGAMTSAESDRARLVVARAGSERAFRERQAAAARSALAATWGETVAGFELAGRIDVPVVLPPHELLLSAGFTEHPAIVRAVAAIAERAATVSLQRANRVPDVTVAAGARHFNDDDDVAAVFALSAPLPLFDRNQGHLAEAEARLARAREERRSAEVGLRTSIAAAYDRYAAADEQRAFLDVSVLPAATRLVETTAAGHRDGLFPYPDVLEARRTLYGLRSDRVDALEERILAAVELERIANVSLLDSFEGGLR